MLKGGAPGRKIIVTTRSEQVAKRMNRELPFKLGALPYDDCWKLFKAKAFPNGIKESEMAKVHMGEKIVKKCDGVPLAVKSLGDRLLDMPMHKWEETLKSDLWEHERDPTTGTTSTAILPSLKISYYHMPYYLRPCFVYFSAFPKGFVIEKRELIHKWIALRFVLTTHRAEEYLHELCQMSFLEATSDSISISARYSKLNNPHNVLFKMHDLVHELARSVAIEEVAICDGKQGSFGPKKDNYRYTLLLNFKGQHPKCKDMPFKARAAHFSGCTGCQPSKGAFSETKWLRVLDFPRMQTVELPSSMENLHHLQFLNLSENTSLKKLHSSFSKKVKLHSSTSICDFQKLHYLDLHGCSNLSELPGPIHRLQVLEHLDLSGCTSLQKLPSQFGELQKLSFLNLSCCSKLEMLPDSFSLLKNLEHLNLSSCCQLKQLRTLSFKRMKGLLYLNLSGCTCLEALPEFCVGNDGCLNLEILDLSDCGRLIDLSESCARLNKLRFLNLSGCPCIPKIICFLSKFVNLEYLNLSALSGFDVRKDSEAPSSSTQHSSDYSGEELSLKMLHDTLKNMHCLEYLSVGGMSLFSKEGISSDLLTLPDFVVSERGSGDCSNIILLQNILDSTNSELNIKCLEVVTSAEEAKGVQLGRRHRLASLSLEWSSLEWSEEPQVTTRDVLENLKPHPALKHLTIKGYNYSMFPSWMREICSTLPNLVKLVLSDLVECDQLPTLGNLSNLQELEIRNMPKLMEACLAPCRNLKRLSLVELAFGCTLWFCQDGSALRTNRSSEEIHDMELDPSEEFKRLEVFRTQSGDPSRGKGKAKFTAMTRNMMETLLGVTKKRTQMTHVPVSSSAPCPAKEAFPPLCYLKIEHCNYLKLKPRIPNSQEFFINESSIPTLTRINSDDLEFFVNELSIPTLTRINSGDLVIEQTIQKLKISNCKSFDLQKLPGIQSVHELEIDCLEKFHRFYELRCMDRLVKLTLSSPENFLHTDKAEILKAIPQIQCIKINGGMYFAVQESDFLLRQNTDFGITDLFISNLEKVNSADEVGLGELATYDQLRTLRLS
ncbi:putative disease resistance protein RGA1 isoform X2 [Setaria italica]|uniref:putative disease resistance protein RGA1 isoform X2 n=1 Tax=Setaria italica TaxID=4555 RepID=UPI000BE567AC|nr:putative disease resistance protein RGA1 isoform X2 [Setaria italica]